MHGFGATFFGVCTARVRALSALVRVVEVPVDEFPLQRPWCAPLPVPRAPELFFYVN